MIRVNNLNKSFDGQQILKDISLEIGTGEIVAILGGSGAGKSVLLKHLIGLYKPDSGNVFIDNEDITQLKEKDLLNRRINMGYLFQEGALYDYMSVFENLAFPLREHTLLRGSEIKAKIQEILSLIDMKGAEEKLPAELSGGMKKRVALARALILESKILFCDEPTSGLDPIRSRAISDLIKKISKRMKCTTVITSHDIRNSFRICDRAILIRDGSIAETGTENDFKNSSDPYVRDFMS